MSQYNWSDSNSFFQQKRETWKADCIWRHECDKAFHKFISTFSHFFRDILNLFSACLRHEKTLASSGGDDSRKTNESISINIPPRATISSCPTLLSKICTYRLQRKIREHISKYLSNWRKTFKHAKTSSGDQKKEL